MKNILLATTAIALTAGYASAEYSISATAKLSYGNFGEEHKPGASTKSATTAEGTVSTGTAEVASTAGTCIAADGTISTVTATNECATGTTRLTGSAAIPATAATTARPATMRPQQQNRK